MVHSAVAIPVLHLLLAANYFAAAIYKNGFDIYNWQVTKLYINVGPYFGGKTLERNMIKKLFAKIEFGGSPRRRLAY